MPGCGGEEDDHPSEETNGSTCGGGGCDDGPCTSAEEPGKAPPSEGNKGSTCGGGGCDTGPCSSKEDAGKAPVGSWSGKGVSGAQTGRPNCFKCRDTPAAVSVRMKDPMCVDCLEASILGKIKCIRKKVGGVLRAEDNVVVTLSGGPCSLALLYLLVNIQNKVKGRPAKGVLSFNMTVVHVQEASAYPSVSQADEDTHTAAIVAAAHSTGYEGQVHVVPLYEVFKEGVEEEKKAHLQALLRGTEDMTGREDLVEYLRNELILRTASTLDHSAECGIVPSKAGSRTLVMRGDNASSLAIKIIADVSKGRGFSLPGDVQLVDARYGHEMPILVSPAREVTAKELACLARFRGITPASPLPVFPEKSRHSINQLAEGFVCGLQENVPSVTHTILKTAFNLQPFPWNDVDIARKREPLDAYDPSSSPAFDSAKLCGVCKAPLSGRDTSCVQLGPKAGADAGATPTASFCWSCRGQIMSQNSSAVKLKGEDMLGKLPEYIKEYLILE
eukprot:gene30351-35356_t